MKYDAIVIGAGNGGLVAALTLQKEGKNVLLLDSHNMTGGLASSFIRGRFEFDVSLQELGEFGEEENHGELYDLFKRLGVLDQLKMKRTRECFHVISNDTKEEYVMPSGISNFISKMEEYVPGSKESMIDFFDLAEEVNDALDYLNRTTKRIEIEYLKEHYPNFMKVSSYSVDMVFKALKLPKKAQEILSTLWVRLGSPTGYLSFVHYAKMLYSYVKYGAWVPLKRSHEMSVVLQQEFLSCGGSMELLAKVTKIMMEDDKAVGVKTSDGTVYNTDYIISNVSPTMFYGTLVPKEMQTTRMNQICNARTLSVSGVCVYLGLNRSAEELGLKHYSYFVFDSLDSNKEYQSMKELYHNGLVGTLLNHVNPKCSEENTCILTLTSFYTSDIFSKKVTEENYYELKNSIANQLISSFEKATNTSIRGAIEEIEIATPVTFARYTGHPEGAIYGYMAKGYDNLLPRILNESNESCISNVTFCGGFASQLNGYSSTYLSGEIAAEKVLRDVLRKEKTHENSD